MNCPECGGETKGNRGESIFADVGETDIYTCQDCGFEFECIPNEIVSPQQTNDLLDVGYDELHRTEDERKNADKQNAG